ncbi:disease resistance protein RUN1-like isoform X2 [Malus sylvestris]|uniref:disease resistance protein RUN1-like isoform X1 n=1 Tax=Malus sylvestris TaxID=3752 RepID=UPI0021AC462E|nr:disease resistance protein RUN1-like isoform X1 [Malus sylvestris]XP_050142702.1 disease resistance protein RUN1-like isoform X2 [Malus sylvestris]
MTSREPSSSKLWSYDVFLSFRGEDTRNGFTSHLHAALQGRGFDAFIDEDNLKRGGEIKPELLRAIEGSRISVIVFSKSHAESRWCLDELVKIMECRERLGQQVLPIFYHVDPSHVRKQEGCLARAFQKHEDGILEEKDDKEREAKKERVKQWREALTQAANLSGHHLNNGPEAKVIKTIVEKNILELLPGTDELQVAKYPVGIDSRVQPIINDIFSGGLNDVKMVGIWGMGGLGKTTAANAIYNKIHHCFQFKCHLGDVSDTEHRYGLVYLQKQLVSNMLKQTAIFLINSVGEGISVIKRLLRRRKVLIVIDNVDKVEQLSAIARDREWFGPGSIIIITTRDQHLLNQVRVNMRYPAKEMNEEEALELFSWYTFENNCPKEEYFELSKKVVSYCGGLPLALKVLGSTLFGRPITEWQSYLEKLKRIPEGEIIEKLKIGFHGLDYNQKTIFLDISCCFLGLGKDHVTKILDECGFYATNEISVLNERCLITIEWGKLKMHDLIREMGKTIISEKSPTQPGRWSRLWNFEAITDVLTNKSGTEEIEALSLQLPSSKTKASFSTKAFVNMKKLRLLRLNNVEFTGSFKHFPKELRWLGWHGFPFEYMPEHLLNQPKIVALDLRFSKLRKGWKNSKPLENLKILDLACSWKLKKSPDFSMLPNLGELNFSGCSSLSKIHPSISQLKKLTRVDFQWCHKLRYLPAEFYMLKSVETLCLSFCALRELPEGLGEMVSLSKIDAKFTAIKQFPNDLGRLISLQELIVGGNSFRSLPSLSGLSNLVMLRLGYCRNLRAIPDLPTNLKVLDAILCPALETMPDFSQMSNMERLFLSHSPKVTEVPGLGLGKSLNSMAELDMYGCANLTAEFRNNILQGWTSCGVGGILLNKIYGIPEWFDFVADGNKVSFDVPQCQGRNFKGLTLCWVWSQFQHKSVAFTVVNCTKHTTSRVSRLSWGVTAGYFRQVQLSNNKLKLNLQVGDKIVILLEGFEAEKLGVNLVWDKPLKENKNLGDYYYEYDYEAVPDWLYGESSPGPSHGASDNHPTNQMTTTTDEPKRKRQRV